MPDPEGEAESAFGAKGQERRTRPNTPGLLTEDRVSGHHDITVTMAMSGEGETWVDHQRLQLSPDGNVLTVLGSPEQSGWTLYRVR